jgi:hypothetical protein
MTETERETTATPADERCLAARRKDSFPIASAAAAAAAAAVVANAVIASDASAPFAP